MDAALWGFLGTLVGAAASFAATYFSAKHAASLQSDAATGERLLREQLLQRETLIELQSELSNLIRANAQIFMEDLHQYRQGEPWPQTVTNAETSEAARRAFAQVSMLNSRITHNLVRTEVWTVRELLNHSLDAETYDEAQRGHHAAMRAGIDVIERIGEEIRKSGVAV